MEGQGNWGKKRTIRENNLQMRKREIHVWKGEKY
jgi:hypothetical protein